MTTALDTYLSFDGDCEAAFKFYATTLRGEIVAMLRYADAPPEVRGAPETANRIMHARLNLGGHSLMGGDAPPQYFSKPQGFCVSFGVADPAEADRVFAALAEGGKVDMPISETFWARRFGMCIDRFGIPWMVNCPKPGA